MGRLPPQIHAAADDGTSCSAATVVEPVVGDESAVGSVVDVTSTTDASSPSPPRMRTIWAANISPTNSITEYVNNLALNTARRGSDKWYPVEPECAVLAMNILCPVECPAHRAPPVGMSWRLALSIPSAALTAIRAFPEQSAASCT